MIELKEDSICISIIYDELMWDSDGISYPILEQQLYAQMLGWA